MAFTKTITISPSYISQLRFNPRADNDDYYDESSLDTTTTKNPTSEGQGWSFIGRSSSSTNLTTKDCGVHGCAFAVNFSNNITETISKITSITIEIPTTRNSSGYNGCEARIAYIGNSFSNTTERWRVGSSDERITLSSGTGSNNDQYLTPNIFTTTDTTTCQNLKDTINNSSSLEYFRVIRENGQGAQIGRDTNNDYGGTSENYIKITIEYESGPTIYVHNGSTWVPGTVYVKSSSGLWEPGTITVF